MASKSLRQKVISHKEQFAEIPLNGQFRKRDVDVFVEDQSLWCYLTNASEGALEPVGTDDENHVTVYELKPYAREIIEEYSS